MMTKFRIFLQPPYVPGFEQPVPVEIDTGNEPVKPGPADALLYVLDAVNKPAYRAQAPHEYQPHRGRPWTGNVNRIVARPNGNGHFDHLAPDDPAFPAASVYATARLVLNFWNRIFREAGVNEHVKWHHDPKKLEDKGNGEEPLLAHLLQLVPRSASAGARAGYGYVELGSDNPGHRYQEKDTGVPRIGYQRGEMWQNFDVIAHEVGHAILFTRVGFPKSAKGQTEWFKIEEPEFLAFHESMADLMAILSLLGVKEARKFVLARRDGVDLVAGVGELQNLGNTGFLPIRSARNQKKHRENGEKLKNEEAHQNSMPLTGAIFETLSAVYAKENPTIGNADGALEKARDVVAKSLAQLWNDPAYLWDYPDERRGFRFSKVAEHMPRLVAEQLGEQAPMAYPGGPPPKAGPIQTGIRGLFNERNLNFEEGAAA